MASTVIHMCVCKEINKTLKIKDENMFLLGGIAPDISKLIGQDRDISHFIRDGKNIDLDYFLEKYKNKLNDPFMLGYFVHLYTDVLWEDFFSSLITNNCIKCLDGSKFENTLDNYKKLIYNDYTNLNVLLLSIYNLDLSLFYNEAIIPKVEMDEIPVDKLNILLDQAGLIIANTKINKSYVFDIDMIKVFIEDCRVKILDFLNKINN